VIFLVLYLNFYKHMILENGKYTIQGLAVTEICEQLGTPLYVYDSDIIIRQIKTLKEAFSNVDVKIKYAAKALSNISILKLMKKNGIGVDVVSIHEAHLALKAGFNASEIMFTPSCAEFEEIEEAVSLGLTVNIDNLSYLKKFGKKFGDTYGCGLRLNPHIMAGGNLKISTGHSQSKFGISIEQMDELLAIVKEHNIVIKGLHIHTGSEITETAVFVQMSEILFKVAENFPNLSFIDFGSGFKVAYKEGDNVTNMQEVGTQLSERFKKFCQDYGRQLELWIEPGKFLVSEAGRLLVKTTVVKYTHTVIFVGVNSGLNHLIRPMMYDAYHHIINISNPNGVLNEYNVVGYICETDTIGSNRMISEVREGDMLSIENAGAYGFSMASNYNSRLRPAEVLVVDGKAKLIRKRESFEDLLNSQVAIDL
jgi:diaminopimelate decarboxylase